MKQCPACNREYDERVVYCPIDGNALKTFTLLDDKYLLEDCIGEGGMGRVFRATHVHIGTKFAVKILHQNLVSDQIAVERFRREARAAAQINHPNAVLVTDFGVTKEAGTVYLVMEFLEGRTLRVKLDKERPLDYEQAFVILYQICSAVKVAHSKGIIHRDLKPDNIFIVKGEDEGYEHIKVLDFGIAKLKSRTTGNTLTGQGMILGTPYYMSPEQCRSEELDARSDIYSLGVILYEMLTGELPFSASSAVAVVVMHALEKPRPLHDLRADIPPQIEEVVMRALAKQRADRQGSVMQLVQEFELAMKAAGLTLTRALPRTPQAFPSPFTTASLPPVPEQRDEPTVANRAPLAISAPAGFAGAPDMLELPTMRFTESLPKAGVSEDSGAHQQASSSSGHWQTGKLFSLADSRASERTRRRVLAITAAAAVLLTAVALFLFSIWHVPAPARSREARPKEKAVVAVPPEMVLVPAGKFVMGNNSSDDEAERPEHEVTVAAFLIDKYEVTNEQYYEFMKATSTPSPGHWKDGRYPAGEDRYPVINVSWTEAERYARWAGKRLPTEAEWEYAARGTDRRLFPWGNDFNVRNTNSKETNKSYAMPVGSYPKGVSPFGLFDMAGNVAEWTASDYLPYGGSKAPPNAGHKIVRGGSYFLDRVSSMVTTRFVEPPDTRRQFLGFRCAKDLPAQ